MVARVRRVAAPAAVDSRVPGWQTAPMATPTLITIAPSHYCEKARLALQRAGLPFTESAWLPLLHVYGVRGGGGRRSTPVLVTGDRTLTVYLLENGQYGRPEIYELKDATPIGVLPGVSIAWDALVTRLPKPEY